MDIPTILGRMVGIGLGIGVAIGLATTVVLLPISWFMNRYIYHGIVMRGITGVIAVMLFPIVLIWMFIFAPRIRYFTALPIVFFEDTNTSMSAGWFYSIWKIVVAVFDPIMYTATDEQLAESASHLLLPASQKAIPGNNVVPENLFMAAQQLASVRDRDSWQAGFEKLRQLPEAAALRGETMTLTT